MKICPRCGAEVAESDRTCPKCGRDLVRPQPFEEYADDGSEDSKRLWLKALAAFLCPPVGFMLAAFWRGSKPRSMRAALAGSVVSLAALAALVLYLHSEGAFRPETVQGATLKSIKAICGLAVFRPPW